MKLTKLVAAPERAYKVPPRARAIRLDAGTASQLIPGVRLTLWVRQVRIAIRVRERKSPVLSLCKGLCG